MPGFAFALVLEAFAFALGFFVPAAILIALVVGAVVRDRRLSAREAAEDARQSAMAREEITPPRAD